jgi:hypothetical protein
MLDMVSLLALIRPVRLDLPVLPRFLTRPQLLTCYSPLPAGRDIR